MKPLTIVVGMSGGVDSSVSAFLLKEQGHNVIGLFMKNWEELDERGVCHASKDYEDVVAVCSYLKIPCYSVNFVEEYRERVFSEFLKSCKAGLTPNPDILCNREIKFNVFLQKAKELGADYLATGHYCRTQLIDGSSLLLKGLDPTKDQSYFLHAIHQEALRQTLFPVGHLPKKEVREIAKKAGLSTAQKKDSTGICFIGKRDFKSFLQQFIGYQQGPFLTLDGTKVGMHDGVAYYTIGQRKGLGLGGEGDAWYVLGKDLKLNAVIVDRGEHHPALFCDSLIACDLSWIHKMPDLPLHCSAKIRYRQTDTPCTLTATDEGLFKVDFNVPQRAATPGQSIVFYDKEICLGGGIIVRAGPSYYEQNKPLFCHEQQVL